MWPATVMGGEQPSRMGVGRNTLDKGAKCTVPDLTWVFNFLFKRKNKTLACIVGTLKNSLSGVR